VVLLQLLQTVAGTTRLYDGRILLGEGISDMLVFDDHCRPPAPDSETDGPRTRHPSRCFDRSPLPSFVNQTALPLPRFSAHRWRAWIRFV